MPDHPRIFAVMVTSSANEYLPEVRAGMWLVVEARDRDDMFTGWKGSFTSGLIGATFWSSREKALRAWGDPKVHHAGVEVDVIEFMAI
jgi:hypothetical protein